MQQALASREYPEGARPDAARFADPESMLTLLAEEYRVLWPK